MIKYLGSKRTLIPAILEIVRSLPDVRTVGDLFSGTARVGHALKREGYRVIANDALACAHTLALCYVQADREGVVDPARAIIDDLNRLPGVNGYVTETFCERSRYFQPANGRRIDAIRAAIASMHLEPELEAICLTALIEAADRVDSTTGVQMAYLKRWAPRAHNDLRLRVPDVLSRPDTGKCRALNLDAHDAAGAISCDLAYLDPPYNQHSYLGNYHVWETIVRNDQPDVYGVACKRIDCRTRKSEFNSKPKAAAALARLVDAIDARYLLVSFNDEGYISRDQMESMLASRGNVHTIARDYKRYVGAQIGIHNPSGEKVGAVSHLRNTELLYLVVPSPMTWRRPGTPESQLALFSAH